MMRATRHLAMAALAACCLAPFANTRAAVTSERVLCARDANGALRVLVLMPPARWQAGGFQVTVAGKTLGHIRPDPQALSRLSKKTRDALERLPARARAMHSSGAAVIIYGRLLSDWRFARAAGMGGLITNAPHSIRIIRIRPTNGRGPTLACRLSRAKAPPAPARLHAKASESGVALYWQPVGTHTMPLLSYRVQRDGQLLTHQAPFLPFNHKLEQVAYLDTTPPLEQDVTYQVRWVDPLGRKGPWGHVRIYVMDFAALRPPARVIAKVDKTSISLHWQKSTNQHTAGYVVERAYLNTGPYEVLTPKGIAAAHPEYHDSGLQGGTLYFYRVRAMGPRGNLGEPSDPVAAQARSTEGPPAPSGLKAQAGRSRVRLKWEPLPGNIAGYIVERRAQGSPRWSRLNQELWQAPRYDDLLGTQAGGTLAYRVIAVTQDNLRSPPSKIVRVRLLDTTPPLPPRITTVDGSDGRVKLHIQASRPIRDTARIYVLRGGSASDPGLVIGKPLPGDAEQFEDTWVQPGRVYWYHLVAYDAAGNRSADGQAVEVRVGAPLLRQPPKPKIRFLAKPIARVRIQFQRPPKSVAVLIQSSLDGVHWLTVAGPTTDTTAQDLNPGTGVIRYRIRYRAANGTLGPPSASVSLQRN